MLGCDGLSSSRRMPVSYDPDTKQHLCCIEEWTR